MNFHFELSQHQMPLTQAHQCSANVHNLVRVCFTKWPHTETRTNQSECALRAHVTAKRRSLRTPLQALPPRLFDLVWNFTDWARTRCIFLSGFFHVNDGRCDEARLWLKSPQLLGNQGSASAGTTVHPPGPGRFPGRGPHSCWEHSCACYSFLWDTFEAGWVDTSASVCARACRPRGLVGNQVPVSISRASQPHAHPAQPTRVLPSA